MHPQMVGQNYIATDGDGEICLRALGEVYECRVDPHVC